MRTRIRGHMTNIQSHLSLAVRYQSMADALTRLEQRGKITDEQKKARNDLEEQALEHRRKFELFHRDTFIMIL